MNLNSLIIEDFDFTRYPITQIYPLADKTVIQIGECSILGLTKKDLLAKIESLEDKVSEYQEDSGNLESANDELEYKNENLQDQLDAAFEILSKDFGFIPDFDSSIAENLLALKDFIYNPVENIG